jgi:hypothetical protein
LVREEAPLKALKKLSNVSFINSNDLSKALLNQVNWAKYRLQPVLIVPPKPPPSEEPPGKAVPTRRVVSQADATAPHQPVPVLKKKPPLLPVKEQPAIGSSRTVEQQPHRGTSAGRGESGSKKRVTINDVPEFEPSRPPTTAASFANQRYVASSGMTP